MKICVVMMTFSVELLASKTAEVDVMLPAYMCVCEVDGRPGWNCVNARGGLLFPPFFFFFF